MLQVKYFILNTGEEVIVITKELIKESNRESKFTKKKRSVDRSEGKSVGSYHDQNKKKRSEIN
jgi:hypothetical protein